MAKPVKIVKQAKIVKTIPADVDPLSRNKELADILGLIGSYYIASRDTYRARSFNSASAKIAAHEFAILSGAQARKELTGIGDSIETAIDEYINTGTIQRLQELEAKFPERRETVDYFRSFYGIGPVTAVRLYDQGLRTLEDLWFRGNLNEAQKLGVLWRDHIGVKIPREEMDLINMKIGEILNKYGIHWIIAGSYRRGEPTSGDIDLLVESRPDLDMNSLVGLLKEILPAILSKGEKKVMSMIRLDEKHDGHRIDIRLVPPESWAPALMYFTGSQKFNILMRQRAIQLGMLLNEYGLFRGDIPLQINSEEDIFRELHVRYFVPEHRIRTLNTLD